MGHGVVGPVRAQMCESRGGGARESSDLWDQGWWGWTWYVG